MMGMDYVLEERLGNPDLFTGRKADLAYFLGWISGIEERKSKSTALLARRKMGKTALMERLFNITFHKNGGVIPFYYEIKERDIWVVDFCVDFCLTFVYQYLAFKTRKPAYLRIFEKGNLEKAAQAAEKEGFDDLVRLISGVRAAIRDGFVDLLWETVRDAPKTIAYAQNEFIVQMIDEFQFLNAMVYWDQGKQNRAKNLAGGYLSTAESKVAPLLVSGSWVGWLMNELNLMLPARFKYRYLENMPEEEAVELVFKYSQFFEVPVTEETAYVIARHSEGSPFYMSAVIRSECPGKDLRSVDGLIRVLEFETLDDRGEIKSTWMEYLTNAFPRINERNAKHIVLYLCKHRDREVTRKELMEELKPGITEGELEERLDALVRADIIKRGKTNYDYQGVPDNIFDKVFRGVYQKEIESFDVGDITREYGEAFTELKKQYDALRGKYNYRMGYFAEYVILDQLKYRARGKNEILKSITRYLPEDFGFCKYSRVWKYHGSPEHAEEFSVDIYARSASPGDYSIIGEVKSRETRKFSKTEAIAFEKKFAAIEKTENLDRAIGFIYSRAGFTKEAEQYCKKQGIACSEDEKWLEI